jgi:hypothetical protein
MPLLSEPPLLQNATTRLQAACANLPRETQQLCGKQQAPLLAFLTTTMNTAAMLLVHFNAAPITPSLEHAPT